MRGWARTLGRAAPSALVVALAVGAGAVVTGVGDRYHARLDTTARGEQRLSERTAALIGQASLLGESEIVVVVDRETVDWNARRTVADVLDLCGHAGRVRTIEIDAGSSQGQRDFAALIERLVERDREGLERHGRALADAASSARAAGERMDQAMAGELGALLEGMRSPEPAVRRAAEAVEQWAGLLRVRGQSLVKAADSADAMLEGRDGGGPLPNLPAGERELVAAVEPAMAELEALAGDMRELAGMPDVSAGAQSRARGLMAGARELRDGLARLADGLATLPRVDAFRVADALSGSEVALVIGPPGTGIAGIDISALYEPTIVAADGRGRLVGDVRAHAEELISSAFSSILATDSPIVVLTHGESVDPLENFSFFDGMRERLGRRGIDMVAWGCSQSPEPPALRELDPEGLRTRVYVTLAPDSSAAARNEGELPGPERAAALGRAVAGIVARGEPLLLNVNPSILPSYGEVDPLVAPLAALGVRVKTGAPLLGEQISTQGRRVFTDLQLLPEAGEHPVRRAVAGLPTLLPWPIPIEIEAVDGVRVTPLVLAGADGRVWVETQWLRYWQTARAQRPVLPDQPRFDEGADERDGPWTVGVVVDRAAGAPVVVVGSNGWFANPAAFEYRSTDGRVSLASPGNAELFEASVLYLAGMEGSIARSATAQATPLVAPMARERVSALRWALVAGMPLATLFFGVVWRVARG